ncbi:DUF805 domain-containing protein [Marinifilum flexuosum]|uniref:DUF805 domain-containing protein n=1 Tax=Marinifilum flexuosum TaxID=1117708 RepID=UPI00249038AD|nr:DUF805 domain-containing protein [Marinifilum flexuosum]
MNPFKTKGRITIKEYAWNIAISIAILTGVIKIANFMIDDLQGVSSFYESFGSVLLIVGVIFFLISVASYSGRRLQDIGKSPSGFVTIFIPLYNLYMLMILFSQVGFGNNMYGPEVTRNEVKDKVYLLRLISIILMVTICDQGFQSYNEKLLHTFLDAPEKNDLYVIKTDLDGQYKYQLYNITNVSDNQINFAVANYVYISTSEIKKDIESKEIKASEYFIENITVDRESLNPQKIEKIIRYY